MRLPSRLSAHRSVRSDDDADIIRARLRALLAESNRSGGWVPDDDDTAAATPPAWARADPLSAEPDEAGPGLPPGIGRHRAPGRAARWDPGRAGTRSLWLAGLLAALLVVVWTWLDRPRVQPVSSVSEQVVDAVPPAGEPAGGRADQAAAVTTGEPAASAEVVVSVVGLVAAPGLVTLPAGARVADAVAAAGGLLPEADPATVNLAAPVVDGEQIAVGAPGSPTAAGTVAGSGGQTGGGSGGRVNVNTATAAELDQLPGIGPVLAERIVAHRTANGRFTRVDELQDVPGIGPAVYERLADRATV